MKNTCLILIIIAFCFGCSPEKRLSRILHNNPQLKSVDSVLVVDSVLIPGINVSATIEGDSSTEALDSTINNLSRFIPDSLFPEIEAEIRTLYRTRKLIKDTATRVVDGVTIRLWQNGSDIGLSVSKPDDWIVREIKVPCPDLEYIPTWWDRFWITIGKVAIVEHLLLILGAYLYGKFKRK